MNLSKIAGFQPARSSMAAVTELATGLLPSEEDSAHDLSNLDPKVAAHRMDWTAEVLRSKPR